MRNEAHFFRNRALSLVFELLSPEFSGFAGLGKRLLWERFSQFRAD
jgi:hypothetical protein